MAKKKTVAGKAKKAGRVAASTDSAKSRSTAGKKTAQKAETRSKKNPPKETSKKKTAGKKTPTKQKSAAKKTAKVSKSAKTASTTAPRAKKSSPAKRKKKLSILDAAMQATSADDGLEPEKEMPKTHLTDAQLQMFREMLMGKRRELLGDVRTLTKDALGRSRQDSAGDLSSMPIHMADIGSDNWEQDFTLGLIANERHLVREIDEALSRIDNRTYGVCLVTHRPITIARLRAKPWAKYCIEYARQLETGRA